MTFDRTRRSGALCFAAALAAAAPAASAVDAASAGATSSHPGKSRAPAYRIVSQSDGRIHAKCATGGNVIVAAREKGSAAQRDRDILAACKGIDYSK